MMSLALRENSAEESELDYLQLNTEYTLFLVTSEHIDRACAVVLRMNSNQKLYHPVCAYNFSFLSSKKVFVTHNQYLCHA